MSPTAEICLFAGKWAAKEGLKRFLDWPRAQQNAQMEKNWQDMTTIGMTIGIALLAAELGKEPSSDEVQRWLNTDDPDFAPRLFRLFTEGAKSPSRSKREKLALVLFGLRNVETNLGPRNRIDSVIERLHPGDYEMLDKILELQKSSKYDPVIVEDNGIPAFIIQNSRGDDSPDWAEWIESSKDRIAIDSLALESLEFNGCIRLSDAVGVGSGVRSYRIRDLKMTELGILVAATLRDLHVKCMTGDQIMADATNA